MPDDAQIAALIRHLLAQRQPEQSICPSEVARALSEDPDVWRNLMPQVREVAAAAARAGVVRVTQQGRTVQLPDVRGPIRLMRGPQFD